MVIDMIRLYLTSLRSGSFSDLRRCILSVLKDCYHSRFPFEHLVWIDGHSKDLSLKDYPESCNSAIRNSLQWFVKIYWSHYNRVRVLCKSSLIVISRQCSVVLDSDDWIFRGRTLQTISTFVDHNINILGTQ